MSRAGQRDDEQGDQRDRQRQLDVDEAHEHAVATGRPSRPARKPSAAPTRRPASAPKRASASDSRSPKRQRREQIAAELIGAQEMVGVRALEADGRPQPREQPLRVGIEGREPGREQGRQQRRARRRGRGRRPGRGRPRRSRPERAAARPGVGRRPTATASACETLVSVMPLRPSTDGCADRRPHRPGRPAD